MFTLHGGSAITLPPVVGISVVQPLGKRWGQPADNQESQYLAMFLYLDGGVTLVSEPVRCLKAFGDMYLCPHALPLNRDILFACIKCFEICWAVKLWVTIPASFSVGCERGLFTDCVISAQAITSPGRVGASVPAKSGTKH